MVNGIVGIFGLDTDAAEKISRAAAKAASEWAEIEDMLRRVMGCPNRTADDLLEFCEDIDRAWERAKINTKLHAEQQKRRQVIERRFRAEIRGAESRRFYRRMFRPPRVI